MTNAAQPRWTPSCEIKHNEDYTARTVTNAPAKASRDAPAHLGRKMNEHSAPDAAQVPVNRKSADDSVDSFAQDLRALREKAGTPTLADLGERAELSRSVLSNAFAGQRLPTETTVRRLVAALGEESGPWVIRRDALDPRRQNPESEGAKPTIRPRSTRSVSLAALWGAVAATALLAIVGTTAFWWAVTPTPEAAPTPTTTYLPASDGIDPMLTECRQDAVLAGGDEFLDGQVLVEMMYSNTCMAVWGRVTRYDAQGAGNTISMRIYPRDDPDSERAQSRTETDVQSLYTPLLIEPNVEARVCGVATVSVGEETFELPNPVCI